MLGCGLKYNQNVADGIAFLMEVAAAESISTCFVEGFERLQLGKRLLAGLKMRCQFAAQFFVQQAKLERFGTHRMVMIDGKLAFLEFLFELPQ